MMTPKDKIDGLDSKLAEQEIAAEFQSAYLAALRAVPALVEVLASIDASLFFLAVVAKRTAINTKIPGDISYPSSTGILTPEDLAAFPVETKPDGPQDS
jgi:hypothetical protein